MLGRVVESLVTKLEDRIMDYVIRLFVSPFVIYIFKSLFYPEKLEAEHQRQAKLMQLRSRQNWHQEYKVLIVSTMALVAMSAFLMATR